MMTEIFYPFDSGAGASVLESQWSEMARNWVSTGVLYDWLNKLAVYADSTGMQVKVRTGAAWMRGHFYKNDAEKILTIATSDPTNPR